MPWLNWISDEDLIHCVKDVLRRGLEGIKKAEKDIARNGIDPFSATFDIACSNTDYQTWLVSERRRQSQKPLQNALGAFHQQALSKVNGWRIPDENFLDLVCDERRIVVELKNKHNTVKKSDLKQVYDELQQATMHKTSSYRGYLAYYATVIPKNHEKFDKLFTPPDNATATQKPENSLIREIDGYSFYGLVTGNENALKDLYQILPDVIKVALIDADFSDNGLAPNQNLKQDPMWNHLFLQTFGL